MKHNKNSQNANHSQTSPQQHGDFLAPTLAHDVCSSTPVHGAHRGIDRGSRYMFLRRFLLPFSSFILESKMARPSQSMRRLKKINYIFSVLLFSLLLEFHRSPCVSFIFIYLFFIYYTWDMVFITCNNYIIIYLSNFIVGAITFHIF